MSELTQISVAERLSRLEVQVSHLEAATKSVLHDMGEIKVQCQLLKYALFTFLPLMALDEVRGIVDLLQAAMK